MCSAIDLQEEIRRKAIETLYFYIHQTFANIVVLAFDTSHAHQPNAFIMWNA
jgi:hypothetical protein